MTKWTAEFEPPHTPEVIPGRAAKTHAKSAKGDKYDKYYATHELSDESDSEDYSSALGGSIERGGHEHFKDETLKLAQSEQNKDGDAKLQCGNGNHENDNIQPRPLIILLAKELSKSMFRDEWFATNRTTLTAFVEEQ